MHIAHILASLEKNYGGPPRIAAGLGTALSAPGVKISYWAPARGNREGLIGTGEQTYLFPLARPRGWFRSPDRLRELKRDIDQIDLLHIHEIWSYPQWSAARLARRRNKPYLIVPHGELEPWRVRHKGKLKFIKKKAYLSLGGLNFLKQAACLQAGSSRELKGYHPIKYRGPVTIVPNGINPEPFQHLPDRRRAEELWPVLKEKRVVLFLSRLNSEKGLDQLIPAWARLKSRAGYEDAILVLAGPEDRGYGPTVNRLINRYQVSSKVLLPGMVQGLRKMALMSRAEIYTLPSPSEGFSMAILENLAAGNPLLITPGCNFPEVAAAEAGLSVNPVAEEIEAGLRKLLDLSPDQRREMGERGRELVNNNYTWDIAARKMITVYRAILNGDPIPLYPEPTQSRR